MTEWIQIHYDVHVSEKAGAKKGLGREKNVKTVKTFTKEGNLK